MSATLIAAALLAGAAPLAVAAAAPSGPIRDVVLVHGAVMDGSAWRGVYDRLRAKGYRVTVAQLPLTGYDQDLAAARAAIAQAQGPAVLVGHSYGGAVITAAGMDPKVRALVYVAAHQPDVGESVADLNARDPLPAHVLPAGEGAIIVDPAHFRADVAADVPEKEVDFLAHSQRPTAGASFMTKAPEAAWHTKPSWAIVATQDCTISPKVERYMYARSKAHVTEIDASHLVFVSRPDKVTAVIEQAAAGAK